ncbi:MAG: AAA family ATPase [Candidatus Hodarchaeota archaeon]
MRDLHSYIDAGYPAVYIRTTELERAFKYIVNDLKNAGLGDLSLYVWKSTTGLYPYAEGVSSNPIAQDFFEALRYVASSNEEAIGDTVYVFFNIQEFLRPPVVRQQLRDVAYSIRTVGSHLIFIGGDIEIPQELEDLVITMDFPLPNKEDIKEIFSRFISKMKVKASSELVDKAAMNALGLTAFRAESAIALSVVERGKLDIDLIREEKRDVLKKSGTLEFMNVDESMDSLGGFDVLKDHVKIRSKYFSDIEKSEEYGLEAPKGILIVGPGGTGKSLSAKCIAATLGLDLYKLDLGAVFKGIVGQTEATIRQTLKIAEMVAPAVLLMDEFDRIIAGSESSGRTDSGVTSRLVGTLLTWMQESKAPLYKVATCNSIRNLEGPMFRRGRWDELFSVDLPTSKEREAIFAIHLRKRKRNPEEFDLKLLASKSDGFVGAEIESSVASALYTAFSENRELQMEDIISICERIVPLSITDQETMDAFRKWVKNRAVSVSAEEEKVSPILEKDANRKIRTQQEKEQEVVVKTNQEYGSEVGDFIKNIKL